jgi:hypothetical protein
LRVVLEPSSRGKSDCPSSPSWTNSRFRVPEASLWYQRVVAVLPWLW